MTELEKNKQILTMLKQMCDKAGMVEGKDYYYDHEKNALWIGQTPDEGNKWKGIYITSLVDARGQIIYSSDDGDRMNYYYEPFLNSKIWDRMTPVQQEEYVRDRVFSKAFLTHAPLTTGHTYKRKVLNYPIDTFKEDLSMVQEEPLTQYQHASIQSVFYKRLIEEIERNSTSATREMDHENFYIYHVMRDYWDKKMAVLEKDPKVKEWVGKERPFDYLAFFENITADKETLKEQAGYEALNARMSAYHAVANRLQNADEWREKYNEVLSNKDMTEEELSQELKVLIIKANLQYKKEHGKELTDEELWKLQLIQKREDLNRIIDETKELRRETYGALYNAIEKLQEKEKQLKTTTKDLSQKYGKAMDTYEKLYDTIAEEVTSAFKEREATLDRLKKEAAERHQKIAETAKEYEVKITQLEKTSEQNTKRIEELSKYKERKIKEIREYEDNLNTTKKDFKESLTERLDKMMNMRNAEIIAREYNDHVAQASKMTNKELEPISVEEVYRGIVDKKIEIKNNPAFTWKDKLSLIIKSVGDEINERRAMNKEFKEKTLECEDWIKELEKNISEEIKSITENQKNTEEEKNQLKTEKVETVNKMNQEARKALRAEGEAFRKKIGNDELYNKVLLNNNEDQLRNELMKKNPQMRELVKEIDDLSKKVKESKKYLKDTQRKIREMQNERNER